MLRSRLFSGGAILLGAGMVGLALYGYFVPIEGAGVSVEEPEREIAPLRAGMISAVTFPVHNSNRHPVKVVGLAVC